MVRIPGLGNGGPGQKRDGEEPRCYVGEGEEIPEVQGEEEEGYPSDIRFRSASPMDASGTGGPPSSSRRVSRPHQGIPGKSRRIVQAIAVGLVSHRQARLTMQHIMMAARPDWDVPAKTRDGNIKEKEMHPHLGTCSPRGRENNDSRCHCWALCFMSLQPAANN